jgi:hypothetical protein
MKPLDIFIAYVSWESGGKYRPVLIIGQQETIVFAFIITTQYVSKTEATRARYFKINDWQQAGLEKQSYVDTNTVRDLPSLFFDGKMEIGRLTEADERRLIEFINKQ